MVENNKKEVDKNENGKDKSSSRQASDSTKKSPNTLVRDVLSVINRMDPSSPTDLRTLESNSLIYHNNQHSISTTKPKSSATDKIETLNFDDFSETTTRSVATTIFDTEEFSNVADKATSGDSKEEKPILIQKYPEHSTETEFYNHYMHPPCQCTELIGYLEKSTINPNEKTIERKSNVTEFVKMFFSKDKNKKPPCDYYKINKFTSTLEEYPPKRLVFDLVNSPKRECKQCKSQATNHNINFVDQQIQATKDFKNYNNENLYCYPKCSSNGPTFIPSNNFISMMDCNGNIAENAPLGNAVKTRVDVYYFDHGNSAYLRTTDKPPIGLTELFAEKTEAYTSRFWAETFGSFQIGISFCTGFILQLFRFIIYSIIRPLTIGIVQLASDYFFKPCLTTLFNAVIQPPLIFLYNIATSLRDLCDPLAEGMGYFLREFGVLFSSCRLFDYFKQEKKNVKKVDKNIETV